MNAGWLLQHTVAVQPVLGSGEPLNVVLDFFVPSLATLRRPACVVFCLPGGAMTRSYYDLCAGSERHSFARAMQQHGLLVAAVDHPGAGDSSKPADGFALTPWLIAEAHAQVVEKVVDALRDGTASTLLPPLPEIRSVGVGHSIGGLLLALQQADFGSHAAIAMLGASAGGRVQALNELELAVADDPIAVRAQFGALTRHRFPQPYFAFQAAGRSGELFGGQPELEALAAMRRCQTHLLATLCEFAVMSRSFGDLFGRVSQPVLLAAGDEDMCRPVGQSAALFTRSNDLTLLTLPHTGHGHFAFRSAAVLFERMATWIRYAVNAPDARVGWSR